MEKISLYSQLGFILYLYYLVNIVSCSKKLQNPLEIQEKPCGKEVKIANIGKIQHIEQLCSSSLDGKNPLILIIGLYFRLILSCKCYILFKEI